MIEIKITENKRLDQVVYEKFGTLENFEKILNLNSHLIDKIILDVGDIVYLPERKEKKTKIVKGMTLWD